MAKFVTGYSCAGKSTFSHIIKLNVQMYKLLLCDLLKHLYLDFWVELSILQEHASSQSKISHFISAYWLAEVKLYIVCADYLMWLSKCVILTLELFWKPLAASIQFLHTQALFMDHDHSEFLIIHNHSYVNCCCIAAIYLNCFYKLYTFSVCVMNEEFVYVVGLVSTQAWGTWHLMVFHASLKLSLKSKVNKMKKKKKERAGKRWKV